MGEISDQNVFFSKHDVSVYKNVVGIYQSIQNQKFCIGSKKDKNDLIQKDEIW